MRSSTISNKNTGRGRHKATIGVLVSLLLAWGSLTGPVLAQEGSPLAGGETNGAFSQAGENGSVAAVTGEGTVKVDPEVGYLTLAVETVSTDPRKAQEENTETIHQVVAALKDLGIEESDIRSGHYRIHQDYRRPEDQREPEYRVTNQLEVTVRNLDQVGEVLTVSVDHGVNRISSVEFGVDEAKEEEYQMEALEKALHHSQRKGELIAGFYGSTLGNPVQVNESRMSFHRVQMDMDMATERAEEAYGMGALPADPEQVRFEARVDVIYRLHH